MPSPEVLKFMEVSCDSNLPPAFSQINIFYMPPQTGIENYLIFLGGKTLFQ